LNTVVHHTGISDSFLIAWEPWPTAIISSLLAIFFDEIVDTCPYEGPLKTIGKPLCCTSQVALWCYSPHACVWGWSDLLLTCSLTRSVPLTLYCIVLDCLLHILCWFIMQILLLHHFLHVLFQDNRILQCVKYH
jgi:hypothetical protein